MHEDIKRFSLAGLTDNNAKNRDRAVDEIERQMRDEGFVPSIDNDPQYTAEYQPIDEVFEFNLSVYGVYVGVDESWQVSGMTAGKKIMRPTPQTR